MDDLEIRCAPLEFRAADDGGPGRIVGTVIRYSDTATLAPGLRERFEPGAFGDLSEADVRADRQHVRAAALARTGGGGLTLTDSPDALRAQIDLPDTQDGRDCAELMKRGVLRGLSAQFAVMRERFEDGTRIIERASIRAVSVVDSPQYSESTAALAVRAAIEAAATEKAPLPRIWL